MSSVAIVIPAFKAVFLDRTLRSIAGQTCHDFTVYVGDDASPEDLESIVVPFSKEIPIVYRRFAENLGSSDLVKSWERVLDLVEEDWIWLFSDDDMMPEDGVERLLDAIKAYPGREFFRFPLSLIDNDDSITRRGPELKPGLTSAQDMLTGYFCGKTDSAACEYVFSKALYTYLGMVHFPAAWCADVATWFSYASSRGGVVNIPGKPVLWRNVEGVNISSTAGLHEVKMQALIGFVVWLQAHWDGKAGKHLRSSLRRYLETNLMISFNGEYTNADLRSLCRAFASFDFFRALKIYLKYRKR